MYPQRLCTLHASSKRLIQVCCLSSLCFSVLKIYRVLPLLLFNFRRCFRRSSLSAFYKIGVLKTSVKFLGKHVCRSLLSIKMQTFWPEILNQRLHHWSRNTFLQDTSRWLLLIFGELDIQTFNSKQFCSLDQYCRHGYIWWVER